MWWNMVTYIIAFYRVQMLHHPMLLRPRHARGRVWDMRSMDYLNKICYLDNYSSLMSLSIYFCRLFRQFLNSPAHFQPLLPSYHHSLPPPHPSPLCREELVEWSFPSDTADTRMSYRALYGRARVRDGPDRSPDLYIPFIFFWSMPTSKSDDFDIEYYRSHLQDGLAQFVQCLIRKRVWMQLGKWQACNYTYYKLCNPDIRECE